MERLTTNKEKSEMEMYELAHNCCYCKDGLARYRDFENDIDARELTRRLLKNFADSDDAFVDDDDDFDEEMLELLMCETNTIEGLIALFYRNMWAMADLRERLNEYENLEEQGLLLRLPCKVGDTVLVVTSPFNVFEGIEYNENLCNECVGSNGWIACSERLPEESGYYLVTYRNWSDGNFLPKYDDTYVRRLHYQISDNFVGWNYPKNVDDRAENDCHKEVIAWQPLPEVYKN